MPGARPILLLGSTGQIGTELLLRLAGSSDVVAPSRADADLGDPGGLVSLIRRVQPGVIWNCAAFTNVEQAESDLALARRINAQAPGVLAEAAREADAVLCHWSTDYVFDGAAGRPYREDDVTAPLNRYGLSKAEGEEYIRQVGCRHLILRTSWVYSFRRQNFLRSVLTRGRLGGVLDVVADQVGAPTPAGALAAVASELTLLLRGGTPPPGGTYHLTAGGATTWAGFAEAIRAGVVALGAPFPAAIRPVASREYPSAVRRPAFSVLSNEKLRSATGLHLLEWQTLLDQTLRSVSLEELVG